MKIIYDTDESFVRVPSSAKNCSASISYDSAIYQYCPNAYLVEMLQETMNRLAMMRRTIFLYIPQRGWASIREHTHIIELLEAPAPAQEIEQAAREHKLRTIEAYKSNKDHVASSPASSMRG